MREGTKGDSDQPRREKWLLSFYISFFYYLTVIDVIIAANKIINTII